MAKEEREGTKDKVEGGGKCVDAIAAPEVPEEMKRR